MSFDLITREQIILLESIFYLKVHYEFTWKENISSIYYISILTNDSRQSGDLVFEHEAPSMNI